MKLAMQKSAVFSASELSPELKRAVEALLGQPLEGNETVSLRVEKDSLFKEAPIDRSRENAFRLFLDRADRTAGSVADVPEKEVDEAIDEAVDYVRRNRK